MTNWDYKLDPPSNEERDQIYDRVNDMSDPEILEYAKNSGLLDMDEDGNEIVPPDLGELRDEISEHLYWNEDE